MKATGINARFFQKRVEIRTHTGKTHQGKLSRLAPCTHENFLVLDAELPVEVVIDLDGIESIQLA